MAKYFLFMFLETGLLRDYLNLAVYALNPREKWPAHVTIAGPFRERAAVPRSLKFSQQVSILGRGRFLNGDRHTVYLHVGSRDMGSRMYKPDFPTAIPHLSLYSGHDEKIASLLYDQLGDVKLFGIFHTKSLEIVSSTDQFNFNFRTLVDTAISPLSKGYTLEELRDLSIEERVLIAVDAVKMGLQHSAQKSAFQVFRTI